MAAPSQGTWSGGSGRGGGPSQGEVVAGLADGLRDDAPAHEHAEDGASDAEPGERLEGGGHDDEGDDHASTRSRSEQGEDEGERGERRPHALGEALGRSRDRPRREREPWPQPASDYQAERAETGSVDDAGDEAVGEHRDQRPPAREDVGRRE